jgi:hypothetical protein
MTYSILKKFFFLKCSHRNNRWLTCIRTYTIIRSLLIFLIIVLLTTRRVIGACEKLTSQSQSHFATDGRRLGLITRYLLLFDSCGLVFLGRPLWREDGFVFCICCWSSPAQSFLGSSPLGLVTIFYCLRFETSIFVAFYDSQGHGGGIRTRLHTGGELTVIRNSSLFADKSLAQLRIPHREKMLSFFRQYVNNTICPQYRGTIATLFYKDFLSWLKPLFSLLRAVTQFFFFYFSLCLELYCLAMILWHMGSFCNNRGMSVNIITAMNTGNNRRTTVPMRRLVNTPLRTWQHYRGNCFLFGPHQANARKIWTSTARQRSSKHASSKKRRSFPWGPCRRVILKTICATSQPVSGRR